MHEVLSMSVCRGNVSRFLACAAQVWVPARGARVFSRRPVRVHLKGSAGQAQEILNKYEALKGKSKPSEKQKVDKAEQKSNAAATSDEEKWLLNGIRYKLLSEGKSYERMLLENMKKQKYRTEHQLFKAEGYRIIREALHNGATPQAVYFTRLKLVAALSPTSKLRLEDIKDLNRLPLFKAPYKKLQMWSTLTTSPGIVGIFKIPKVSDSRPQLTTSLPLTLLLDEVRDPGNLGVILRTAAAVGVEQVLLLRGCCDPWEEKVVRAGCGAHFRLKMITGVTWDKVFSHVSEDSQIFLADVCHAEDVMHISEEGEEEKEDETKADNTVNKESVDRGYSDLVDGVYELDDEGNKVVIDNSYNDPEHLELYRNVSLPLLSYNRLQLKSSSSGVLLAIGGEVGISTASKKFVADNLGSKVTVPLANGMDSLNVGVATGIILYEMQKQLHEIATQKLCEERHESGG